MAALAAVVVAGLGGAQSASAVARAPHAKTLVTVRGSITGFAQDGKRIAWIGCGKLVIRNLRTRSQSVLTRGIPCDADENGRNYAFAFGGVRALWLHVGCGISCYYDVLTATRGDRHAHRIGREFVVEHGASGAGTFPVGVAAAGRVHFFSVLTYAYRDESETGVRLWEGSIQRVSGDTATAFSELPAAAIAVSGDRIAAVPAEAEGCACNQGPKWSPDGRLVAFATGREGPDSEIAVMGPEGGEPRVLTNNFHHDTEPTWAPDGSKLAFATQDSLRVINADGTGERTLVTCPNTCSSPDWAPDGTRIAFSKTIDGSSGPDLFTVNPDGSNERQLTQTTSSEYSPAWSPDGTMIAFTRYTGAPPAYFDIYVMRADGTHEQRLAGGYAPSYSPDGATIAFSRRDGIDSDVEVYAMNADGAGERQLTNNAVDDDSPDWSPDATRLAFVRQDPGAEEIYVMNVDGSGQERLTNTHPLNTRAPAEIRKLDGSHLTRFAPSGAAESIALTPRLAAVLVSGGRSKRIELFNPVSGARRGSVRVPSATYSISAAGQTVVFHNGRTIRVLDAVHRKLAVLTVARREPIGLSIEGRRIAWAESGEKRSRIRALFLRNGP